MMNLPDEQIIAFLTQPKNVECTLDILANGEGVYASLLNEFWKSLLTSLRDRAPSTFTAEMKQWTLDPGIGRMGGLDHSSATSSLTPPPKQGQKLLYRIQQRHRLKSYHLFFGLLWYETLENKKAVPAVSEVIKIRDYHADAQFTMQGDVWYCGWTDFFSASSREAFFSEFVSERDQMTNRYADRFWTYVNDTREWVDGSNRVLQNEVKRFRRVKP